MELEGKRNPTDVIVNNKSNFKCQLTRCQRLIDDNDEIVIRGLGRATSRAVNLALELNLNNYDTFNLDVMTSCVERQKKSHHSPKRKAAHALGIEKDKFDPDEEPIKDANDETIILISAISITVTKHPLERKKATKSKRISDKDTILL